jgi:hypothetical protein
MPAADKSWSEINHNRHDLSQVSSIYGKATKRSQLSPA